MSLLKSECAQIAKDIKQEVRSQIENLRSTDASPLQDALQPLKAAFDELENYLCPDRNFSSYAEQMNDQIAWSKDMEGTTCQYNNTLVQPGSHPRLFPSFNTTDIGKVIPADGVCMKYLPYVLTSFYWNSLPVYSFTDDEETCSKYNAQYLIALTTPRDIARENCLLDNVHKDRALFLKLFTLEDFMKTFKGQDCRRIHPELKLQKSIDEDIYSKVLSAFYLPQSTSYEDILMFFYQNILLEPRAQEVFDIHITHIRNHGGTNEEKKQKLLALFHRVVDDCSLRWHNAFHGADASSQILKDTMYKFIEKLEKLPAHKLSELFSSFDTVFEKGAFSMAPLQGSCQERFFFYHKCEYMALVYLLCAYMCAQNDKIRHKIDFEESYLLFQHHTHAFDIQMSNQIAPLNLTLNAYLTSNKNHGLRTIITQNAQDRMRYSMAPQFARENDSLHKMRELVFGKNFEYCGLILLMQVIGQHTLFPMRIDIEIRKEMDEKIKLPENESRHILYYVNGNIDKDEKLTLSLEKDLSPPYYAEIYFRAVFMHRGLYKYGEANLGPELKDQDITDRPDYINHLENMVKTDSTHLIRNISDIREVTDIIENKLDEKKAEYATHLCKELESSDVDLAALYN